MFEVVVALRLLISDLRGNPRQNQSGVWKRCWMHDTRSYGYAKHSLSTIQA